MFKKEKLYALDDVTIVPAVESDIDHRGECNPYYYDSLKGRNYLPIFASPMTSVIGKDNYRIFEKNDIIPMLPRTETTEDRLAYAINGDWAAFSLAEFNTYFTDYNNQKEYKGKTLRVLIDNANGHMKSIQTAIKEAKLIAVHHKYTIEIMAGNVANPETYKKLSEAGADYVRCAIGNGDCCITASQTANNYPMASLIDDCYNMKIKYNLKAKIVADGGINSYKNVNKALALGADYVMIGTTLAKCFESAGEFKRIELSERDVIEGFNINTLNELRFVDGIDELEKKSLISKYKPMKTIFGMSTKKAQMLIALAQGKKKEDVKLKTSEGIEKEISVDYTMHQWVENLIDYLRSSMSYNNFKDIKDYIGGPTVMLMSDAARNSINK